MPNLIYRNLKVEPISPDTQKAQHFPYLTKPSQPITTTPCCTNSKSELEASFNRLHKISRPIVKPKAVQDLVYAMDLQLLKTNLFDLSKKNKKWVLLFTAFGFTSYGLYRVYHSPSIAKKRYRYLKLFGAFISLAEAISESSEAMSVVTKDFKQFIQSDIDKIPNSFTQMSKIANSNEFSKSVVNLTQALTVGVMRGYGKSEGGSKNQGETSSMERVMDKLFSTAGSGFASVVVGSFARNLIMGFYASSENSSSFDELLDVACSEKCRELVGDCIQVFVGTMVAVFLDKTMHINTYDDFFTGLTNPNHNEKMKDLLVSVCNGAVETAVKTSHCVLTSANSEQPLSKLVEQEQYSLTEIEKSNEGWDSNKVWSTLTVTNNQKFVLDVTGKVTFETVRSILEFTLEKVCDSIRRSTDVVHETVVESKRYVTEKSSVIATVCLSVCLHILESPWILAPA
ncbi:hypothetical protein ACFE04_002430 [Oxalis oulophora]